MRQTRFWKLQMLFLVVPMLLILLLASNQAQAQTAAGKAKVDRLVMGLILPYRDYMRPWIAGTPDHNIQHDPAFEWLFEVDPESGKYNPWLAESCGDGQGWPVVAPQVAQGGAIPPWLWRVYRQGRGAQPRPLVRR